MFDQSVEILSNDNNYEKIVSYNDEVVFVDENKQRYITIKKTTLNDSYIQFIVDSENLFYDQTINDISIVERLKNA